MSLSKTISKGQRERLWYNFTKLLINRRILYKGKKVNKYEVFATFLNDSKNEAELIVMVSKLLSNVLPDYKIVWKYTLLGFKDTLLFWI